MADKTLNIVVRYSSEAAKQAAVSFHQTEQARIKATANEQAKSDQAYIRAIKLKLKAIDAFAKEIERRGKERDAAEKRSENEYVRAIKLRERANKDLLNQQSATNKTTRVFSGNSSREETAKTKAAYSEQARMSHNTRRAEMQGMREKHQLAMLPSGTSSRNPFSNNRPKPTRTGAVIGGYVKSFVGLAGVTMAIRNVADRMKDVSEFTRNAANEFIRLRSSMQEVAALKGQPNNASFTLAETEKARAANLTPDEWRSFQSGFQSYAGELNWKDPGRNSTLSRPKTIRLESPTL